MWVFEFLLINQRFLLFGEICFLFWSREGGADEKKNLY